MPKQKRSKQKNKAAGARKRKPLPKKETGKTGNLLSSALSLYEQGDIRGAKSTFRKIVKKEPLNIDANYHLGIIALEQGIGNKAIEYFERALSVDPMHVNSLFSLGAFYINEARYDEADEKFQMVVALSPSETNAYYNLGIIAGFQSKHDEAIQYYEKALSLDPEYRDAWYGIGCNLLDQKRHREAIKWFERVVSLDPHNVDALFYLGLLMQGEGDDDQAMEYYQRVIAIMPEHYQTHHNLGLIFHGQNKLDIAMEYYERSKSINPEFSDVYLNQGNLLRNLGEIEKTINCYNKSIALKPTLIGLANLCGYQKELNNFEEAYELTLKMLEYKDLKRSDLASIHDTFVQVCQWEKARSIVERFKAAELEPETRDVLAGSFMEFCATTDLSLDEISEEHKEWGRLTERNKEPFTHGERRRHCRRGEKLRVGYVSPDFREHSVGYLIRDIIAGHNYEEFDIYCYANFKEKDSDAFTEEIKNACTVFKHVKHLSDHEMAQEIYHDGIHILIDLAGHTAGHRLPVFAYKPAPIQMTYLGYPNTTGMSRIDYRITDRFAEAEGKDYRYSEKLIRLTNCFFGFNGFSGITPGTYEEKGDGSIVFGCFNNMQKVTPKVIELWARILGVVEGSHLQLKAKQLTTKMVWDNIVKEFAKHGISPERLRCLGYTATREEHLMLYDSVDISLDTFPFNGAVTTLEALWMNTPIVSLVGESHAQRVGYTILKNLNLDRLIAFSEEEYVSKSVELARHPEIIRELKQSMRKNLLASSICNPKVITRELELRLKNIWIEYLESGAKSQEPGAEEAHAIGGGQGSGEMMEGAISAASRLRIAMVKLESGEYNQAIEICSHLLDSEGVAPLAWHVLGIAHYRADSEEDAIAALRKSLELDRHNVGAWKLLGEIYEIRDEPDEAHTCLKEIAKIHDRPVRLDEHHTLS